jgi:hypothetical protein
MATSPTLTQIQQGGVPATVSDIVNAIQGQYAGTPMPTGGTSYGAARFLTESPTTGGLGAPTDTVAGLTGTAGTAAPSWFKPASFDIETYRSIPKSAVVNEAIAAGDVFSGGGSDTKSLAEQYADTYKSDIYDPLFNPMPSWLPNAASLLVGPLAGMFMKGANAYGTTNAANNLITALEAYGVDAYEQSNPLTNVLRSLVPFVGLTDDVNGMKALASQFSSPESLFGYYDVATNPTVNSIFSDVYGNVDINADQAGMIGNAISSRIHSYVADGMPLAAAEAQAAKDFGSTSVAPMANYDPMGDFITQLNDPFSDVSLGLDTMTSNTGAQGTNLGNGLVAYKDGSMRDAMDGTVVGGVVTDSQGNPVTTTDGTPVGWGVGVSPTYNSSSDGLSSSQRSEAANTGMATNEAGQTVSNAATIAAQDAASFGDSGGDSGGGGGGGGSSRYCCSRMVHHGLWDVNHEFARLTVWSRKQPRWWRSGYPVWGKIVAKHLLGKVGFWTEVMQAFYDNKVRHKPRTWKSTLGELVIFPGAFVCGMIWREVPQGARLADPKEFA